MIHISLRIRAVWSDSSLDAFWIAKNLIFFLADNGKSDQIAPLGVHVRMYIFSRLVHLLYTAIIIKIKSTLTELNNIAHTWAGRRLSRK